MNTLLIAPESDLLRLPDEARHIQEALSAQTINGHVTPMIVADAITNRIARRQTIDLLFFIGHGSMTGLALSEGYIGIPELCRYVKSANIRYVVLNTCESEYIALAIHHETNATVICTIGQVTDTQAYATSRLLAETIAQGHSVEEAYERAKPSGAGLQTYKIFSAKNHHPEEEEQNHLSTIKMVYALFSRVEQQIKELRGELKREIETVRNELLKEIETVRKELLKEIEAVRHEIKPLENRIYTISERAILPITISVAAAVAAFIVLIWSIFGGN
jgi:hypothetical protein